MNLFSQVMGTIQDALTRKPIEGAYVIIDRTTIAAQTDAFGLYQLDNYQPGYLDIVVYKAGHKLLKTSINAKRGEVYELNLKLITSKKIKARSLSIAEISNIRNTLSLDSSDQKISSNLENLQVVNSKGNVTFDERMLLKVENRITGYSMIFFIGGLAISEIYKSPLWFGLMESEGTRQSISWEKQRALRFRGSLIHCLKSILIDRFEQEGFSIVDENSKPLNFQFDISASSLSGYKKLSLSRQIVIKFTDGVEVKKSTISLTRPVELSPMGVPLNPSSILLSGDMASLKVIDQIPFDYQPIQGDIEAAFSETLKRFYERTYVHTDKPYYYSGERIWFKVYLNYYHRPWQDSLSKTLYVELINANKKIIAERIIRISGGVGQGDIILSDTLKEGKYWLRAYTNLQRNFGDSLLFYKPIPILKLTDRLVQGENISNESESGRLIGVTTAKEEYRTRDKIIVSIQLDEKQAQANLSISITDVSQVEEVHSSKLISEVLSVDKGQVPVIDDMKFFVEKGVGFRGQFLNDRFKPEKAVLNFMQLSPKSIFIQETDEYGNFLKSDLPIYDTVVYHYSSEKARGEPYGSIKILSHERPKISFPSFKEIEIVDAKTVQRLYSTLDKDERSTALKDVIVKGSRIEPEKEKPRSERPYGRGDYTMTAKDIRPGGNLLYSLAGRFPGLVVRQTSDGNWVVYTMRGISSSLTTQSEVLVLVNNVAVSGGAGNVLSSIDPQTVESIEFTNRINVLYGSAGVFGVISVYTKTGLDEKEEMMNYATIKVAGYSPQNSFTSPDYETKNKDSSIDFRSTLYWNPLVILEGNKKTDLIFYASDLEGKYRIEIEGITSEGKPIRAIKYVYVRNN